MERKTIIFGYLMTYGRQYNALGKAPRYEVDFDRLVKRGATMKSRQEVAAEAYQVIGALASSAGLFESEEVVKALDYFGDIANGQSGLRVKEILPWPTKSV